MLRPNGLCRRLGESDVTEVRFIMLRYVNRGKKLGVEISRCEAERASTVTLHNFANVLRACLRHRLLHAPGAVIVGRDRQGPSAQKAVILLQQFGGRNGRQPHVVAFIDSLVDPQKPAACGRHELPNARGTGLGTRIIAKGRLDVRQQGQFFRQTRAFKNRLHHRQIRPRTHQALHERFPHATLKTHLLGCPTKRCRGLLAPKHRQDTPLVRGQPLALTARQPFQNAFVIITCPLDQAPATFLATRQLVQLLIDDAQITGIMQQTRAALQPGESVYPEIHAGLQRLG